MTQNNLGNALVDQGKRVRGGESMRLLRQAVDAFQQALTIRTWEQLPQQWVMTQNNLAAAYWLLRSWREAADAYAGILQRDPDYEEAYRRLTSIYHDIMFTFQEAFEVNRAWAARHPGDTSAPADFVEKHFTTGRFAEFEQQLKAVLGKPGIQPGAKVALQTIGVANLLALGQVTQARARLGAVIAFVSGQANEFKIGWNFAGTRYFISRQEKLARYQARLDELFNAIARNQTRDAILKALAEVRAKFNE
jgi:tetratricopeptide (TPR) repeat protein